MRWYAYVALFAIVLLFLPLRSLAEDTEARRIMQAVEDRDEGDNIVSELQMTLIDKNGGRRERRLSSYTKDDGADTMRIMFFLHPADVRDTAFLTYDYGDPERDDDQWLYLPALKKAKRISSADKSGSFMGSDFNYSDMTSRDLDDYDFKLLRQEEVRGRKVWLIEALPRNKKVIRETGYLKSVLFVRQDNFVVVRAVRWTGTGGRLKYLDVKQLELIQGIWTPTEIHMTTKEGRATRHRTVLRFENVRFGLDLPDSLFSVRQMHKGPPR